MLSALPIAAAVIGLDADGSPNVLAHNERFVEAVARSTCSATDWNDADCLKSGPISELFESYFADPASAGELDFKGGEGVAANPKVIAAAFSDDVLVQGNNSGLIDLGNDHSVVIHVDKHVAAAARPLAEVRADVQKKILDERIADAEKKLSGEALARLDKGEAMPAVATAMGAELKSVKEATRQSTDVPAPLLTQAFLLPHPAADKSQFAAVDMKDGSYALLAVDKVQDGDLSKVPPEQRDSLRQQMTQAYGGEATRELLELLRANAKIKINKNLM